MQIAEKPADTLDFFKWKQKNLSLTHRSKEEVDVLIPVVEKDLCVLGRTINGIRRYLNHPLNTIILVAPLFKGITKFCAEYKVNLIDERALGIPRPDYIVGGKDRSGWLFQQFIKLSGDRICNTEYYFVIDADTVLVRPQAFEIDGKTVLLHSEEHHCPYFNVFHDLFGDHQTELSFVAHQMLFKKEYLKEMKHDLEKNSSKDWILTCLSAVRYEEKSGFSDYELYGQWLYKHHPDKVHREYWYNMSFKRTGLECFPAIDQKCKPYFKSISFHSYEDPKWR